MIHRQIEGELRQALAHFPAVALVGPRQVGKTTLAKKLIKDYPNKTVRYFDLERLADYQRLKEDPEFFLEQFQNELVIIDEIQRLPELFAELRSLIDRHRIPGRFLLLGSASPLLMKKTADSLAGRIAYLYLEPFSLSEIGLQEQNLAAHWWRGGFPEAWLAPSESISFQWREHFLTTYIERDLPFLGLDTDPIRFKVFLQMIALYHGNLWNAEKISRSLGSSGKTVKRYLNFLESSFLALKLPPFYSNIGKRLVKSPKVYLKDSGLLHALLNIRQSDALTLHPSAGASWEGYVISEIIKHLPKGIMPYFFRTSDGTECDLLLVEGTQPTTCIEIKLGKAVTPGKGFYNITKTLKTPNNFIITYNSETALFRNNIKVISLLNFLKEGL